MRLTVFEGDITAQVVDAIVNAANSSLLGGGGVDGAIHRAGGPRLLDACRDLRENAFPDGLPVGRAVATTAGDLPARWVIHTVGPVHSRSEDRADLLASCYRESLRVAAEVGASSVAFPAISAGAYGWPLDDAARIAVETVHAWNGDLDEVRLVGFDAAAAGAFQAEVDRVGPTDDEIAEVLGGQPAERWQAVFDAMASLGPADTEVTWAGGEKTSSGAISMPYPVYSERIEALTPALRALGCTVVFDWPAWTRPAPVFPDGRGLADRPVADAARLATAYLRGERFNDGAIETGLRSGAFASIVERLRAFHATGR